MKIRKGQTIEVRHIRKGVFKAVALKDFDTVKDDEYPIATWEYVRGYCFEWYKGDPIPCRRDYCKIKV